MEGFAHFLKRQFISNSSTDGEKGLKCETGKKVASIQHFSEFKIQFNFSSSTDGEKGRK